MIHSVLSTVFIMTSRKETPRLIGKQGVTVVGVGHFKPLFYFVCVNEIVDVVKDVLNTVSTGVI